jgi:hypothetical protein
MVVLCASCVASRANGARRLRMTRDASARDVRCDPRALQSRESRQISTRTARHDARARTTRRRIDKTRIDARSAAT